MSAQRELALRPRAHMQASDERLARLTRDGDERAFEELIERYRAQLLAHARRVTGEDAAEDALQHALVCAWHSLRQRREVRHLRAWLFTIVHRCALQTLRDPRETLFEQPHDSDASARSVEEEFERSTRARAALSAVAALPLREREALVGTSLQGRRAEDVARELGLADAAFRQLVFRARTRARAALPAATSPALLVRLRSLLGALSRRTSPLAAHSPESLRPLASATTLASALVLVAVGTHAAGPLASSTRHRVRPNARAAAAPATRSAQPSIAARRELRHREASRITGVRHSPISLLPPDSGVATAPLGPAPVSASRRSSPAGAGTNGSRGLRHALAGAAAGQIASPPVPQAPALRDITQLPESVTAAVGTVVGATGELVRGTGAPKPVEGVVTTVVEPVVHVLGGALESVTATSR